MTDLDTLAVQVARAGVFEGYSSLAKKLYGTKVIDGKTDSDVRVKSAILGARAMLAKLRELGLVVEPGATHAPHNREPSAADFPTAFRPVRSTTSNGTGHD